MIFLLRWIPIKVFENAYYFICDFLLNLRVSVVTNKKIKSEGLVLLLVITTQQLDDRQGLATPLATIPGLQIFLLTPMIH